MPTAEHPGEHRRCGLSTTRWDVQDIWEPVTSERRLIRVGIVVGYLTEERLIVHCSSSLYVTGVGHYFEYPKCRRTHRAAEQPLARTS